MTGFELYMIFVRVNVYNDVTVDAWMDLDESQRNIWHKFAIELNDENEGKVY